MPNPRDDETEDEFVERCIPIVIDDQELDADKEDDREQAVAICHSMWRQENAEQYECECLECGKIVETAEHCQDITCPECGGQMRRVERPGANRLHCVINQIASVRQEFKGGVEFLVAPMVAVKPGVLNGELLLADEIENSAGAWNGRPFTIGHPVDSDGWPASANSPDVMGKQVIGQLFNTEWDDRLRTEAWIDVQRAMTKNGGDELLRRLRAGKAVDVSTGYYRDIEAQSGDHNGAAYMGVAHNLVPDHVAALLYDRGACSWDDGCGIPRINKEDVDTPEKEDGLVVKMLRAISETLGISKEGQMDEEKEVTKKEVVLEDEQLGTAEDVTEKEVKDVITEVIAKVEVEEPVDEWAEFGGIAGVKALLRGITMSANAEKEEVIRNLVANEQCPLDAEQLAKLDTKALQALVRSYIPANYAGRGGGPQVTDNEIDVLVRKPVLNKEEAE